MFRNILVPTDGSRLSQKAVTEAIELAQESGAKLVALHVCPRFRPGRNGSVGTAQFALEEAHKNLGRATAAALFAAIKKQADAANVAVETVVAEGGEVYGHVIATAEQKHCDLICMGSQGGRRGLSGFLLGSETQKVLAHSKVPVLVLR